MLIVANRTAATPKLLDRIKEESAKPAQPSSKEHLDSEERPNREDLGAQHNVFMDSVLEPVPVPPGCAGDGGRLATSRAE